METHHGSSVFGQKEGARSPKSETAGSEDSQGITLEEFLNIESDETEHPTQTKTRNDEELAPLVEPLIAKTEKVFSWIASHKKVIIIAVVGVLSLGIAVFGGLKYFADDDDVSLQTQELTETEDRTATDDFWDSLSIASGVQLQAFADICSERHQCHDELIKLVRGPCIMMHYPPAPLDESNALEQETINTMSRLLHVMITNGRTIDTAWRVLTPQQFDLLAFSIIKATSPGFCKAILRDRLDILPAQDI